MKKLLIVTMAFLGCYWVSFSQEKKEFEPHGKPTIKVFTNYHSTFTDGKTHSQFELTRAYLGYEHKFSENWSGKVIFDVGNPKDGGKHEMSAFVKNAMMSYKKNGLEVDFGLIGTNSFKIQEKFWGNRYLLKSFQDEYKFGSSADLGISVKYDFNKVISADFTFVNGEGYKRIQSDSIFAAGAGVTVTPVEGLMFRGYFETTTEEEGAIKRQNTLALFASYQVKDLSVGAEYNKQVNHGMEEGMDWNGISFYSAYKLKLVKFFGRYDMLNSDGGWNGSHDGNLFVIGGEFNPVKGIKIAPNFRNFNPDLKGEKNVNFVYVNCEIKF